MAAWLNCCRAEQICVANLSQSINLNPPIKTIAQFNNPTIKQYNHKKSRNYQQVPAFFMISGKKLLPKHTS
jgi:hypothetical protein